MNRERRENDGAQIGTHDDDLGIEGLGAGERECGQERVKPGARDRLGDKEDRDRQRASKRDRDDSTPEDEVLEDNFRRGRRRKLAEGCRVDDAEQLQKLEQAREQNEVAESRVPRGDVGKPVVDQ